MHLMSCVNLLTFFAIFLLAIHDHFIFSIFALPLHYTIASVHQHMVLSTNVELQPPHIRVGFVAGNGQGTTVLSFNYGIILDMSGGNVCPSMAVVRQLEQTPSPLC